MHAIAVTCDAHVSGGRTRDGGVVKQTFYSDHSIMKPSQNHVELCLCVSAPGTKKIMCATQNDLTYSR